MIHPTNPARGLKTATLLSALATTVSQTLAVLFEYATKADGSNYFKNGAIFPTVATIFAVLGIVCSTLAAYTTPKDTTRRNPFTQRVAPLLPLLGFILTAFAISVSKPTLTIEIRALTVMLLIAAAVYSFLSRGSRPQKNPTLSALLGMIPILACIALNAYYYFDVSVEMNAPLKIATQIGLLCAMLLFTSEVRYLLGIPLPRVYLMLSGWLLSLGALCAIPVPVAFLLGRFNRFDYTAGAVFVLCMLMSTALRVRHLLHPLDNATTDETSSHASPSDVDGL